MTREQLATIAFFVSGAIWFSLFFGGGTVHSSDLSLSNDVELSAGSFSASGSRFSAAGSIQIPAVVDATGQRFSSNGGWLAQGETPMFPAVAALSMKGMLLLVIGLLAATMHIVWRRGILRQDAD